MISMSSLYEHIDYPKALEAFNASNCKWNKFKDIHMKITKNKCPICEYLFNQCDEISRLDKHGNNLCIPTIDHYRPEDYYYFLKCNHKNYILMCFECNSSYKKSKFPLYPTSDIRWTKENFIEEKPLIINPILDNPLKFFDLVFRLSSRNKKVLELKPKVSLLETDYLYLKAVETIKLFGLGGCEESRHETESIDNYRVELLGNHFDRFYALAKARQVGMDEFLVVLRENPENKEYGFTKFIAKEQFEIITNR